MPLAVLQTDNSPQTKTILFQNVRSLHLPMDDVQSDYSIQKADVNILVESKLCLSDRELIHISFVNLCFTEMTLLSVT